jgi:hypothetical protein
MSLGTDWRGIAGGGDGTVGHDVIVQIMVNASALLTEGAW